MKNQTIEALKDTIRHPYCWPGGYTKRVVLADGEYICTPCAKKNFRQLVGATKGPDTSFEFHQWGVIGIEIYWEGPQSYCCHCNRPIDSEYGDPDEPETPIELSYSVFTIPGENTVNPYHVGIDKPGLRVVKYSFKTLEDAERCLTNLRADLTAP